MKSVRVAEERHPLNPRSGYTPITRQRRRRHHLGITQLDQPSGARCGLCGVLLGTGLVSIRLMVHWAQR